MRWHKSRAASRNGRPAVNEISAYAANSGAGVMRGDGNTNWYAWSAWPSAWRHFSPRASSHAGVKQGSSESHGSISIRLAAEIVKVRCGSWIEKQVRSEEHT